MSVEDAAVSISDGVWKNPTTRDIATGAYSRWFVRHLAGWISVNLSVYGRKELLYCTFSIRGDKTSKPQPQTTAKWKNLQL